MSTITQVSTYSRYLSLVRNLTNGQGTVDSLSQQLTNKLLHPPLQALNTSQGDTRTQLVGLVAKLYNLHPD